MGIWPFNLEAVIKHMGSKEGFEEGQPGFDPTQVGYESAEGFEEGSGEELVDCLAVAVAGSYEDMASNEAIASSATARQDAAPEAAAKADAATI